MVSDTLPIPLVACAVHWDCTLRVAMLDDLPRTMRTPGTLFPSEAALCEALLAEPHFWHRFGLIEPPEWRRHDTPDFLGKIRGEKLKSTRRLGIEVELDVASFKAHGHDIWNVHVLVTLSCVWWRKHWRDIPIVSLYRKCDDGWCRWSLDSDVDEVFLSRTPADWGVYT